MIVPRAESGGTAPPPRGRTEALAHAIARRPLVFIAVFLALYGFNTTDFADFAVMTRDPFVTHPDVNRQFLHSSPLTFLIGWPVTRMAGPDLSYAVVCTLGFSLLAAASWLYLRAWKAHERHTMALVAFSTPILLVLSRWIGKGDPYLLAFYLALLACRARVVPRLVLALLLICAHREIGLVLLAGDAVLRRRLDPWIVVGAGLGVALVALYHAHLSEPPFSRVDLGLTLLKRGVLGWTRDPVAHLLLASGWFWMVLFARGLTPDWPRVALVVALCLVISTGVVDYTRVFILCATPVVAYTAEAAATTADVAARLKRSPFPLLFLIQLQLESFDQVSDSQWLGAAAAMVSRLLHHAG